MTWPWPIKITHRTFIRYSNWEMIANAFCDAPCNLLSPIAIIELDTLPVHFAWEWCQVWSDLKSMFVSQMNIWIWRVLCMFLFWFLFILLFVDLFVVLLKEMLILNYWSYTHWRKWPCTQGFFFFYVRAYLGINSMKLKTNGIDHIVTADKYTPR